MLFLPELHKPQMKEETENSRNKPPISQPVSYIKKGPLKQSKWHTEKQLLL